MAKPKAEKSAKIVITDEDESSEQNRSWADPVIVKDVDARVVIEKGKPPITKKGWKQAYCVFVYILDDRGDSLRPLVYKSHCRTLAEARKEMATVIRSGLVIEDGYYKLGYS